MTTEPQGATPPVDTVISVSPSGILTIPARDGRPRQVVVDRPGGAPVWLEGEPEWHATFALWFWGLFYAALLIGGVLLLTCPPFRAWLAQ